MILFGEARPAHRLPTSGLDCRELLKISQQRYVSQTETFHTKNTLDIWKHICVWE